MLWVEKYLSASRRKCNVRAGLMPNYYKFQAFTYKVSEVDFIRKGF